MKALIPKAALVAVLSAVQGIVNTKTTLDVLRNAALSFEGDQLTVRATNLDRTVQVSCECEVEDAGKIVVNAKTMLAIAKGLASDTVEISSQANHMVHVAGGRRTADINGLSADAFPETPELAEAAVHRIGTAALLDAVSKVVIAVSTDEGRPSLNGAHFALSSEGRMTVTGTNGHILGRVTITPPEGVDWSEAFRVPRQILVPGPMLGEVKKLLDLSEPEVLFGFTEKSFVIKAGPMTLSSRLIDGTFPDIDAALPSEGPHKATGRRSDLLDSIKHVSVVAPPKTGSMRATLDGEMCELATVDAQKGQATARLSVDFGGKAVNCGFDLRYVRQILSALDGDEVTLEIIDTLSPAFIRDASRDDVWFVIMPMRI